MFKSVDTLRTWNADSSWNARQHFASGNGSAEQRRFRFDMRRNSYDFQSWVRLQALNQKTLEWSTLVDRYITETPAAVLSYVSKELSGADLVAVEETAQMLLHDARLILAGF